MLDYIVKLKKCCIHLISNSNYEHLFHKVFDDNIHVEKYYKQWQTLDDLRYLLSDSDIKWLYENEENFIIASFNINGCKDYTRGNWREYANN